MSDKFSTTTEVLGGKICQVSGCSVTAVSWFQFEAEIFDTFEAARRWIEWRMDSALAKQYGGKIRQTSSGAFVATNHHGETSIHSCFWEAEEWLIAQKKLARSAG